MDVSFRSSLSQSFLKKNLTLLANPEYQERWTRKCAEGYEVDACQEWGNDEVSLNLLTKDTLIQGFNFRCIFKYAHVLKTIVMQKTIALTAVLRKLNKRSWSCKSCNVLVNLSAINSLFAKIQSLLA